jgi:hypothetical protein
VPDVTATPSGWQRIAQRIASALRPKASRPSAPTPPSTGGYPGDFTGPFEITYDPHPDKVADPGEVVWTWVPFEEDHSQGKDRPVLIVGRNNSWLLAVPMTSKDHDRDAAQEAREGRFWVDIGAGEWDRDGRPSEVRVNRILRVNPATIRRGAGKLDKWRFEAVAEGIRHHW